MDDLDVLAQEFKRQSGRHDGSQAVAGMSSGLGLLSDTLYLRLHQDVEDVFGTDSMFTPVSETKSLVRTRDEIRMFQVAESAAAVRQFSYWPPENDGYVQWLANLVLGESPLSPPHRQSIEGYLSKTTQTRRLAFTDVLANVLPESRRAPLVLFLLFPLAVQVVTAMAFGDHSGEKKLRSGQIELLPIIPSCHQCHGQVLENGQCCRSCANPLWPLPV